MSDKTSWYGSFLAQLSPRVREKLLGLAQGFRYLEGETIFREGDPSLYLYLVKEGRVALETHFPSKGRVVIQTISSGGLFSWSALVGPRIETATARAVEETEALGIKGGALEDLCREDFELGFEVYRTLAGVISARLNATRMQLLDVFAAA
jgi:CRP-like cAMP-binding protein